MNRSGKEWIQAALIRALRTVCQTALSMLTIGMAMSDVDWLQLISISIVAGIISILTSFATGLPEATTEGTLLINTDADDASALMGMNFDEEVDRDLIEKIKEKGTVTLRVEE